MTYHREQILRAIEVKDLESFKSANIVLRGDKEIGLLAVKRNGMWYRYLSAELRRDKDIIFAAVNQNHSVMKLVGDKLKEDRAFALEAVKSHPYFITDYAIHRKFHNDEEIIRAAIELDGWNLRAASENLRNNKEVVLAALKRLPSAIRWASDEIKSLIEHTDNPTATLESIVEKEKLEARHGINSPKEIPDAL